jgi:hypothetical protein
LRSVMVKTVRAAIIIVKPAIIVVRAPGAP